MSLTLSPRQKSEMETTLRNALAIVQALPVSRACRGCDYFDQVTFRCEVWRDVVPEPARADGCDQFSDVVPF